MSKNLDKAGLMSRSFLLYADGGSRGNPGEAAFGAVISEGGKVVVELSERIGVATNNVAEYSGLIAGLRAINRLDPKAKVLVRMDSKLIVEQMSGNWKIKNPEMRKMAIQARDAHSPELIKYEWIPRELNTDADSLVNLALDSQFPGLTVDILKSPITRAGKCMWVAYSDHSRGWVHSLAPAALMRDRALTGESFQRKLFVAP